VVENFVDNSPVTCRRTRVDELLDPCAQKYGMKIFFSINELHRRDAPRRRTSVDCASVGAAVELSRRAGRCFADG
jgi:hypothetical protein